MRYGYKSYWKLPFGLGEIQYGHITGRITIWFRGKRYGKLR